ncbi:MAG: glycosyltransferase family 4 protein [Lutibacter sp.]
MRLLYITNGITGSGGLERVLSVKASMLAEEFGYEVHTLSLNEIGLDPFFSFSNTVQQLSIEVEGNPIQYFLQYKNGIQKVVNEIQPDLISVCDDGLKGFFLPVLIKTKAKWIYERHVSKLIEISGTENKIELLKTKAKWFIMELAGKRFNKFVVLTPGNITEWPGLKNIVVLPNPLPFEPTAFASLENQRVICVGKISFQKGQDVLLNVWEIVHKRFPQWQLQLYGKGNEDFLNTLYLKNNVSHYLPAKNIVSKYAESSIYVMSSRFEGFGMVLIEAMSCGLPVVSFDCPHGPKDIIANGEDGFLVENGNIKDFADRVMTLMENMELRKEMGANARRNVQRFAAHQIVAKWDALFRNLGDERS